MWSKAGVEIPNLLGIYLSSLEAIQASTNKVSKLGISAHARTQHNFCLSPRMYLKNSLDGELCLRDDKNAAFV